MTPRPPSWPGALAASLPLALVAGPGGSPEAGPRPDTDIAWWRVVAALGLCLGLALAAALVLRTRLRGVVRPASKAGKVASCSFPVESLRLSHQVDLCLVACDGQRLLVATSPHGVVLLSRGSGPAPLDGSL